MFLSFFMTNALPCKIIFFVAFLVSSFGDWELELNARVERIEAILDYPPSVMRPSYHNFHFKYTSSIKIFNLRLSGSKEASFSPYKSELSMAMPADRRESWLAWLYIAYRRPLWVSARLAFAPFVQISLP